MVKVFLRTVVLKMLCLIPVKYQEIPGTMLIVISNIPRANRDQRISARKQCALIAFLFEAPDCQA